MPQLEQSAPPEQDSSLDTRWADVVWLAVIGVLSLLLLRRLPAATRMASGRR
ncbi:MAG: hypothetical protein IIC84_02880 [Chloroflexi bacterium]|nr:hypothetical protein [Chloroflexota bacterium]